MGLCFSPLIETPKARRLQASSNGINISKCWNLTCTRIMRTPFSDDKAWRLWLSLSALSTKSYFGGRAKFQVFGTLDKAEIHL